MSEQPAYRSVIECPAVEDVVRLLLSDRYYPILDEYISILEEDPEYLTHHFTSTALRLQFHLKLNDLPSLIIGECIDGVSFECCIIDALKEAVNRRASREVVS